MDSKISLGADLSRGNTDQTEYSARADIKRRTASSRFLAEFLGYRTTSDEQVTKNNIRANGTFDWFYTQKMYFRPIFFEYYRDPFQNIANKYTVGAGVGYYVMDTDKTEWDFSTGPAYQKLNLILSPPVKTKVMRQCLTLLALILSMNLLKKSTLPSIIATSRPKVIQEEILNTLWQVSRLILLTTLILICHLVWDYLADPIADENGVVPEKEDYKMIFALGIDL